MDWTAIISGFLLPILAKCLGQQSTEEPREYIRAHYDAATGKLDSEIVVDSMRGTRKAIRRAHRKASRQEKKSFQKYSEQEIYDLTESELIKAMNADDDAKSAVMLAASAIEDDD